LPRITDQFDGRLEEEQAALADLDRSLESVRESLPPCGRSAATLVTLGRWLAWLGAALIGLHGVHRLLGKEHERGSGRKIVVCRPARTQTEFYT
jgi:hypothetical protein